MQAYTRTHEWVDNDAATTPGTLHHGHRGSAHTCTYTRARDRETATLSAHFDDHATAISPEHLWESDSWVQSTSDPAGAPTATIVTTVIITVVVIVIVIVNGHRQPLDRKQGPEFGTSPCDAAARCGRPCHSDAGVEPCPHSGGVVDSVSSGCGASAGRAPSG